jgi:predicted Fe-Mo cluster-binding NifX family protein
MMRIAISAQTNNGLDSLIAQHFGRCPYFALVDVEDTEVQTIRLVENPFFASHEVGHAQRRHGWAGDPILRWIRHSRRNRRKWNGKGRVGGLLRG